MNTWTFKVCAACLGAALVTGCVPAPELSDAKEEAHVEPLTKAKLGRGVSVVAPDGFCVDPESLSSQFALLARCDTLGMRADLLDAPLAVITVSMPRASASRKLPAPDSLVTEAEALLDTYESTDLQLVRVAGQAPAEGLSGRYWRGAGVIGRSLVGLAIYPAAGGPDLDEQGVALLEETFNRSRSNAPTPPEPTASTDTPEEKERTGFFARLFQ